MYGFSPVCIRICIVSLSFRANPFPQTVHSKALWPPEQEKELFISPTFYRKRDEIFMGCWGIADNYFLTVSFCECLVMLVAPAAEPLGDWLDALNHLPHMAL